MAIPPDVDVSSPVARPEPRERGRAGAGGEGDPFRLMVEESPVGIFHADAAGEVTYWNARGREMASLTAGRAGGDAWTERVHPDDRRRVLAGVAEAVRDAAPIRIEY